MFDIINWQMNKILWKLLSIRQKIWVNKGFPSEKHEEMAAME